VPSFINVLYVIINII